jgi:hypothetical protein
MSLSARKQMVGTRRLELLTSTVSSVPGIGILETCMSA